MSEVRQQMIADYFGGNSSFIANLVAVGKTTPEEFMNALIVEIIKEADVLKGNELIATQDGDLKSSSVISTKRSEVLERAIKAISKKREADSQNRIDLDSPMMKIVLQLFVEKIIEVFAVMNLSDEEKDVFLRLFPERMKTWREEVRHKMEDLVSTNKATFKD